MTPETTIDTAAETAPSGQITLRALAIELTTSVADVSGAIEDLIMDGLLPGPGLTDERAFVDWDTADVQVRGRYYPTRVLKPEVAQAIRQWIAAHPHDFAQGVRWDEG